MTSCRVLEAPAPVRSLAAFLSLPLPGEPALWDGVNLGDPETFASRGIARAEEVGLSRAAEASARLFADIDDPRVRALAAFPFDDTAPAGPFASFGPGRMLIPRLSYVRRGASAFLRLIGPIAAGDEQELVAVAGLLDDAIEPIAAPREVRVEDLSLAAWTALVEAALGEIRLGLLTKIVVARRAMLSADEPFDVAVALARLDGDAATRFAIGHGGLVFIGATPERLVSLKSGLVELDALAGTAPKTTAPSVLLADEKERREHAAVIAGIAESLVNVAHLAPVGDPSVDVLRHVIHLRTRLTATPATGVRIFDLVRALHPTPAVGGLPRTPALAFLRQTEPAPRGLYAGPIGCFDAAGEGAFVVAIRSALVSGRGAIIHAGAGIVAGSDPTREYEETRQKQRVAFDALGVRP